MAKKKSSSAKKSKKSSSKTKAASSSGFSIEDVLSSGWNTFKDNWQFLLGAALIAAVVTMVGSFLQDQTGGIVSFIFWLASLVANSLVSMGFLYIVIELVRGNDVTYNDFLTPADQLVTYLLATLLVGIIVGVGLLLLVVPGIIWALKYAFVPYVVIDQKKSVMDALAESSRLTDGHKLDLLIFWVVAIFINALGALAAGLGLLVTIPVTSLAYAQIYNSLSK